MYCLGHLLLSAMYSYLHKIPKTWTFLPNLQHKLPINWTFLPKHHGRFQYTRKAFKWHNRNCGAGIKTINQTFGPMGVLARYRNICQLRHLGRAKCKHIPDELWRWQANIVTTIFIFVEKRWQENWSEKLSNNISPPPINFSYKLIEHRLMNEDFLYTWFCKIVSAEIRLIKIFIPSVFTLMSKYLLYTLFFQKIN